MAASRKKFAKYMLKVGRYHSGDGIVDVTPDRLAHFKQEFDRLRGNGYTVPVHWDHAKKREDAVPMSRDTLPWETKKKKDRSAAHTCGEMIGFDPTPEGNSAKITLDLRRQDAIEAAEANDVHLSPIIFENEWSDGRNNRYKDLITHMDLVNHPVDNSQTPFEQVPDESGMLACGIRMANDFGPADSPKIFLLAKDDEDDDDED